MTAKKFSNAFTIVELVAVVSILSLLLVVAYPYYGKQLNYNHVSLIKAHLLDISSRQDSHLSRHKVYAQDLAELGIAEDEMQAAHYRVVLEDVKNDPEHMGYTVKALPLASLTDNAGVFSLNHLGQTSNNWNP